MQEQFFQLWQLDPSSLAYNSGFMTVLNGHLHLPALQAAAQLLFDRQQVSESGHHEHMLVKHAHSYVPHEGDIRRSHTLTMLLYCRSCGRALCSNLVCHCNASCRRLSLQTV